MPIFPPSTGQEANEAEERGDEEPADNVDLDPQTKEAFNNILRGMYQNTAHFAAELLQDRFLQKQLRLIVHVLGPLHHEYASDLRCHKGGQTEVLYWHGDRAAGSYYATIAKTGNLLSEEALRPQPLSLKGTLFRGDPRLVEETKLLTQYFSFIVELCANRAWSQSFWTLCFPYAIAGLHATDTQDRLRSQTLCRNLCTRILQLEDILHKSPQNKMLVQLRNDLGTCDFQLVREILVLGHQCNFSWQNHDLRELCFLMFAGPGTTKDSLESAFNHLKDSVKCSKSKKFNSFTKFFYLLSNPYVQHAGVDQIRPTIQDFHEMLSQGFQDSEITRYGIFHYRNTDLSEKFPTPNKLLGQIRKAGFFANRKAAAASAFLLHDSDNDFANVSKCWAGGMV